jgi:hypothetical protein
MRRRIRSGTTAPGRRSAHPSMQGVAMTDTEVTGWVGWAWFAGLVLLIAGVFDAARGFIALLMPDSAYFLTVEGALVFDVQNWGWWHLLIGILMVLVAAALFVGQT